MGSDADDLAAARRLLERALGMEFEPIPEADVPQADLRSIDGTQVAEVKKVTSGSLRKLSADVDRYETSRDVPDLARRWLVLLNAQTNSDSLPPMPNFAELSPAARADYEAAGFVVQTRAEREAEFRATHPGPWQSPPKVKGLIEGLIPHFQVLEVHGISGQSREWMPWFSSDAVSAAQAEILRATRGGLVSSFVPEVSPTGVDVHLGWAYTRTDRADTIAGRIQTWLDSDLSKNLHLSLRSAPAGTCRHGVLIFDPASEPEFEAITRAPAAIPKVALRVPAEIDVIWAIFGDHALSFAPHHGWRSHTTGPAPT